MTNEKADDEINRGFYQSLLARYGDSHQALNWGSVHSQQRRFEVLAGAGIATGESLLDVGCGLGDLYAWLQSRHPEVAYTGMDLTAAMIERARQRFPDARFIRGTLLEGTALGGDEFDRVAASGIFYLRKQDPETYLQRTVRAMFARARKSVAFNTLSTWTTRRDAGEFYADPARVLDFCRTLTPYVVLRHDYHPGDFTIYLYKARREA